MSSSIETSVVDAAPMPSGRASEAPGPATFIKIIYRRPALADANLWMNAPKPQPKAQRKPK